MSTPSSTRDAWLRDLEQARINEVARQATALQQATPGLTRTEALRICERAIPHGLSPAI